MFCAYISRPLLFSLRIYCAMIFFLLHKINGLFMFIGESLCLFTIKEVVFLKIKLWFFSFTYIRHMFVRHKLVFRNYLFDVTYKIIMPSEIKC